MPSKSRSRASGHRPQSAPRPQVIAPVSERQQLALIMRLTLQDAPPVIINPVEERKRSRQQRNVRGETPLHVAAIRGNHNQVKKLLDQGHKLDVPDFAGWTPLHEACNYGWLEVVVILVNGGANVNARGLDDDTPLHDAVSSGNLSMVKFLVEHGADPFVKNRKGKMPSDYADPRIRKFLQSLKESNITPAQTSHPRVDTSNKGGNACTSNRNLGNMESLAQVEHFDGKDASKQDKGTAAESNDEASQISSGVVSSSQDEVEGHKHSYVEEGQDKEGVDDDVSKRKKRKEIEEKETMVKLSSMARGGPGRVLTGNKPLGTTSKTGSLSLSKSGNAQTTTKGGMAGTSGKGNTQTQSKGSSVGTKINAQSSHQGKSSGGAKSSNLQANKQDRKSPVASPKSNQAKDGDGESEEKGQESSAPKVPPLKIVIPGGAGGSAGRSEQEGDGGSGQRGSGKGRGSSSTLPYVIPCTSTDAGHACDSSEGSSERTGENNKAIQRVFCSHKMNDGDKHKKRRSIHRKRTKTGKGQTQYALSSNKSPPPLGSATQRVLRSHKMNDGDKHKERRYIQTKRTKSGTGQTQSALSSNKSPPPSGSCQDNDGASTSGTTSGKSDSTAAPGPSVELHPRKRKIKASKESREVIKSEPNPDTSTLSHNITHPNPYQMYIHIRKQIDRRQRSLFPVKPKPPKDFNKYLMNRCTYTLQSNVNPEPQVNVPSTVPTQMVAEFMSQDKERSQLRLQHLVEKEKLVLAVEQEILRVHGRAERAVANQAHPFSVCTMLRDQEVYNVLAPDQEEKRNAQRSRCNGRQINSWLQEVDDKWERIKEGMLFRQHTEAQTLHKVQIMGWEWKLKELSLCDYKSTPQIDPTHVPQIHVSNFDLPA